MGVSSCLALAGEPEFSGQVLGVVYGDTLEVLRLSGIDCPEKSQAFGKRAKQAASELVFGKEVTLQTFGKDKYGRTLANVLLPGGTNVNHTRVKDSWCWWYRQYAPGDLVLGHSFGVLVSMRCASHPLFPEASLTGRIVWVKIGESLSPKEITTK